MKGMKGMKGMIKMMSKTNEKEVKEVVNLIDLKPADGIQLLRESANEIQNDCEDFLIKEVGGHNFATYVINGSYSVRFKPSDFYADERVKTRSLNKYALGQLCGKLNIPVKYIDYCTKNGFSNLAEDNIRNWSDCYDKDLLLRCYQTSVRGVLSNRYSVLDTPDIIDVIDDATKGLDLKVKGYHISEERFHARLVQQQMMNINGEDLYAGIQIDSSDVGRSPLKVMFFIYKQVCTNGLAISKGKGNLFTQRHLNICSDDFREQLSLSLKSLPELISEYEHIIQRCALQHSIMGTQFFNSKNDFDTVLKEFIQKIKYKTNLGEDGAKKVVDLVQQQYGTSDWGVVNAITEVAQDYTLERRIELEKIAGDMLKVI